jgi:hypothetical protein
MYKPPGTTRSRHRFIPKEIYVAVSKICRFPSLCDRLERERAEVFSEGSPELSQHSLDARLGCGCL